MRNFHFKVRGLDTVLREWSKYQSNVTDGIDQELSEAVRNIATMAKLSAPRQTNIASTISAITDQKFSKTVQVAHPRAAYEEFGTGRFVFINDSYKFTPEEKAFAHLFYVNGRGITKSKAFLFPAFHAETPHLLERIKDVFRREGWY